MCQLNFSSVNIDFCVDYYCSFQDLDGSNLNSDEILEEKEKLVFICSCAIECVKDGGSVLIPISRLGTILQLLEEITSSLEVSAMKVSLLVLIDSVVMITKITKTMMEIWSIYYGCHKLAFFEIVVFCLERPHSNILFSCLFRCSGSVSFSYSQFVLLSMILYTNVHSSKSYLHFVFHFVLVRGKIGFL